MLTLALATLLTAIGPAASAPTQAPGNSNTFEQLQGFEGLVGKAIAGLIGAAGGLRGEGYPLEPGVYVTVANDALGIFDQRFPVFVGGVPREQANATECTGVCPVGVHQAFVSTYGKLITESEEIGVELPSRLLFASAADVPASSLIATIYTAMQTWPRVAPPNVYLVVQNSKGHLVGKHIHVLPPGGVVLQNGTQTLALRVTVDAADNYTIQAIDPGFGAPVHAQGAEAARLALDKVKKRYPNKEAVILQAGENLSCEGYLNAMQVMASAFTKIIVGRPEYPVVAG